MTLVGPPRTVPSQTAISLVAAGTVATSDPAGGFEEGTFHGVFHRDVRCLSRYRLTVDGAEPTVLRATRRGAAALDTAWATAFDAAGDARGLLLRHREIGASVVDRYSLHRLADGPPIEVVLSFGTDRAGLFALKGAGTTPPVVPLAPVEPRRLVATLAADGDARSDPLLVAVTADGPEPDVVAGGWRWTFDPPVGGSVDWSVAITTGSPAPAADDLDARLPPPLRAHGSDHRWQRAIAGAVDDLASLRMQVGDARFTAAGAPWFMALFGRDALLTAYSALPLGTDGVLDVLEALASHQGVAHDPRTLEEPGRILHELRTGAVGVFGLAPGDAYYGTADATPLFVLVLAEAARWGADADRVAALLPAARAAVAWCEQHGDVDGDGYVEAVPHDRGITNQGWKDSGDSMVHADGRPAVGPIALVEVQAYVYAALVGLAELEARAGHDAPARAYAARAAGLRARFLRDFWSDRVGGLVLGLDRDKRPLEVATSNMGHALWTGILPDDVARSVGSRVTAPDLFASWGVRTLGAQERAYSPLAYHRGTIWPHDTAIIAHGLARSRARRSVAAVADELLDLGERFEYRLPELVGGMSRRDLPAPVPYPVACSPQAWSAAAPLLLARAVLGVEPDVPAGSLRLAPSLPDGQRLTITGLRLGTRELTVVVDPDGVEVSGAQGLDVEVARG